jgi:hypothetical protein
MHTAISEVPNPGSVNASFCPTRGSMAALAKWNSVVQAEKTSSGRQARRTLKPDGFSWAAAAPSSFPCRPRATSWSMEPAGTESVATTLATAMEAMSQNTATGPKK